MRPPEFTGGNTGTRSRCGRLTLGFNEAAGIHRRKRRHVSITSLTPCSSFNEAAGIHRRKPADTVYKGASVIVASMRPPEFTGGNGWPAS